TLQAGRIQVEAVTAAARGSRRNEAGMTAPTTTHPLPGPDDTVRVPGTGEVVGRYQVLRVLGSSQDTETFLAIDPGRGAKVVVKTAPVASFSATARMRLEHEALVLTQLQGPPSAALLDFGSAGDRVYLVMPFVPGITLRERLRQGPLSVRDTVALGGALLTTLAAAHDRGVLHRDVKPANVIVEEGPPLRRAT